jgi:hypothetical protein
VTADVLFDDIVLNMWEVSMAGYHRSNNNNDNNPVVLVRERTIPTERLPLVGEVSVNFCG